MTALTDAQLETLCVLLKNSSPSFYPSAAVFLNDLYVTGCRPEELLKIELWDLFSEAPNIMKLQPLKGNSQRLILQSDLSAEWINDWENAQKPYGGLSKRQLNYATELVNPAGVMVVGDRDTVTYIYRYNRVNQLKNSGSTWPEIQEYFGWFNPTMPYSYASRIIEVTNTGWIP